MGINQAIFTSSARGLTKGGGLGIHTYNMECDAAELSEFEQSFCDYVYRGDFSRVSELPTKMVFSKLGNGRCMQAEVTYLGLDYDKVSGRTGNYLSHMYSFSPEDIRCYPMQLYGSPDYRRSMETAEVDGSREVTYLSRVREVRPGNIVTIDAVQEFLGEADFRMEFFCHLLAAVIGRDQIHKIIIYDTHEHIVMWIAALQYALPLSCACEVSFSTYEYNPVISEFDIRGAVAGLSEGDCETYAAGGQYYVFDGIHQGYPRMDISSDYYQYGIQMAMSYAYDSLQAFHDFIAGYSYTAVNADLYDGFKLFQLMQGGMESLNELEFTRAISFEKKYGNKKSYQEMLNHLVERLAASGNPEPHIVENICSLLTGYYDKNLTAKEFTDTVELTVRVEQAAAHTSAAQNRQAMWEALFDSVIRTRPEYRNAFSRLLVKNSLYDILGEFCARILRQGNAVQVTERTEQLFFDCWRSVPAEQRKYFDPVAAAAGKLLRGSGSEDTETETMRLFLKLQEIGGGEIAGRGMEELIRMIDADVRLVEDKRAIPNVLMRKKQDGDAETEELQTKCAFEVFNYTQKNAVELPIARIRLRHLGKSIEKAFGSGKALSSFGSLSLYMDYPVDARDMDENEFAEFIRRICRIMFEYENMEDDFRVLLSCWTLDRSCKEILLGELLDHEISLTKKEEKAEELAAFMSAVKKMADRQYAEITERILISQKSSLRGRILELMRQNPGARSQAYQWMKRIDQKAESQPEDRAFGSILNFRKK